MAHPRLQIFISSTYLDLKDERQAAVEAILKARHIPAGMELFAAGSRSQLEVIKRWIDESDLFILILGHRYGSIEPESGKSYTQVEYEYAIQRNRPFFAVVATDEWRLTKQKAVKDPNDLVEMQHPSELKVFRDLVMGKTCRFFDDKKDIQIAIHESLQDLLREHRFVGWVRGDVVDNQAELQGRIHRLTGELSASEKASTKLKDDLASAERRARDAEARAVPPKGSKDDAPGWASARTNLESLEVYALEAFDQNMCALIPDEVQKSLRTSTALDCAYIWRDQLTTGVPTTSTGRVERFICVRIVPPLMRLGFVEEARGTGTVNPSRYALSQKGRDFFVWFDGQAGASTLADLKAKVDVQVAAHAQAVEQAKAEIEAQKLRKAESEARQRAAEAARAKAKATPNRPTQPSIVGKKPGR